MDSEEFELCFKNWVKKEERVARARKRKYPHFDPHISFQKQKSFFKNYFSVSKNVAKHAFYPFINFVIETPRYKKTGKDSKGKAIRELQMKPRPIAYASHFDAYIYSWFSTLLTSKYEKKLAGWDIENEVLAYLEKDLSNIEFAHEVFENIKERGECVAFAFDISSFFDGLDHEHLKKMWLEVIKDNLEDPTKLPPDHFNVFKSLTKYTTVSKLELEKEFEDRFKLGQRLWRICSPEEFRDIVRKKSMIKKNDFKIEVESSPRKGQICGIPQGSPLSACLSNIYMIDFDIRIKKFISDLGGIYRRYCDDIIIVMDKENGQIAKEHILKEIQKEHLLINDSKTETTYFHKDHKGNLRGFNEKNEYSNLQYLGFEFNGQNMYIRSSSMSRYYRRMSARIRENLKAAYGKKGMGDKVFKKKLFNRYTDKGSRNFITYAKRAMEHMNSPTIEKQYKNSMEKVKKRYEEKKKRYEENKGIDKKNIKD